MTTIRVAHRRRFTSIDRAALNDSSLSFRARGVLAWMLDKPDDWKTTADAISSAGKEGRDAIRAALNELEQVGYLQRRKWRDATGLWKSEWLVYEQPGQLGQNQVGKPALDNQRRISRPQLLKTELTTDLASLANPDCFDCHGAGVAYLPGVGEEGRCACTKPLWGQAKEGA